MEEEEEEEGRRRRRRRRMCRHIYEKQDFIFVDLH